jgi:hypothetical protein
MAGAGDGERRRKRIELEFSALSSLVAVLSWEQESTHLC